MQWNVWSLLTEIKRIKLNAFFSIWQRIQLKLNVMLVFSVLTVLVIIATLFSVFTAFTQIQLIKYLSIWFGVVLLLYWVVSAVWCLYDKDDYGRNVSASDDFYNVSFTSLWLVEGFLLSLFLAYARLFDYYDPFLESEEVENSFINEDVDLGNLKLVLLCFVISVVAAFAVDFLIAFESINSFWVVVSIVLFVVGVLVSFLRVSVRFIEEFDFEEDGEDLLDDVDLVFEHEDFPEEGFDGGDYAEGYEILQLFFGYWHYMLIALHICYVSYAVFASKGKQTHIYWGFVAICQNIVLMLVLDYADWGEMFTTYELLTTDTIYPWFYVGEGNTLFVYSIFMDMWQSGLYVLDSAQNHLSLNNLNTAVNLSSVNAETLGCKSLVLREILADLPK